MAVRSPSQRTAVNVDFSGPFFQHDPRKTVLENVHNMMLGIASAGAAAAHEGLLSGAGERALVRETQDRVADHVIGRVRSLSGKNWTAAAVVQVSTQGLDARAAISLMAAASYVERRTAAIRRVTRQINVAKVDLAKGLN